MQWQPPLPPAYARLTPEQFRAQIAARKQQLGSQLLVLGHHYQQDDVLRFADYIGDSFQLSRQAAQSAAQYIVFCGVHFMAESADILTGPHQKVLLPDLAAGCSMADMAQLEDVQDAFAYITALYEKEGGGTLNLIPITYINSAAALKAFVGQHHGAVCTSSNCEKILRWALDPSSPRPLDPSRKIFFFPDQHLGRNTAYKMGFPLDAMVVWDPRLPAGGLTDEQIRHATFLLWKGHCSVHQLFRPEHVDQARLKHPGIKVIVHPECRWEVVQKADLSGSTDFIGKTIAAAAPGSKWAVGTEVHMVSRLARQHPDKTVVILSECQCLCTTMYRIDPPHLLWTLDNLAAGKIVNQITVDPQTAHFARLALQRMLDITVGAPLPTLNPV